MAVLCCSSDTRLLRQLEAWLAGSGIIGRPSLAQIDPADLSSSDVLIVDLQGIGLPANHALPALPILALSESPRFDEAVVLLRHGVKGYGNRHMRRENLIQAVKSVRAGQLWLPPEIVTRLISLLGPIGHGHLSGERFTAALSSREREVADYVALGKSNQEIADTLFVSVRTVKAHLSSIYEKTGVRNRLELALQMRAAG